MTTSDSEVFAVQGGKVYTVDKGIDYGAEAATERFQVASTSIGKPRSMIATSTHIVWSGDETGYASARSRAAARTTRSS